MLCSRATLRNSDLQGHKVVMKKKMSQIAKIAKLEAYYTCKIEQGVDSWAHRCEPAATGVPPASGSSWSCLASPNQIRMK